MKFETYKKLSKVNFRRQIGVKICTYEKMVETVRVADKIKKARGGRPNKLCIEDRVLLMLFYLRENTTFLSAGFTFGISQSAAQKTIVAIENYLQKDSQFQLAGKRDLLKAIQDIEAISIDVTEIPIARPKKNNVNFTLAKKSVTL